MSEIRQQQIVQQSLIEHFRSVRSAIADALDDSAARYSANTIAPLKVVLAVSGGLDSMALLDACAAIAERAKLKLFVGHVQHHLRAEAEEDAQFVREEASMRGIPFLQKDLLPPAKKTNLEAWARQQRYQALESMRNEVDADVVCTGHSLDDQAETFILRLCSGRLQGSAAGIEAISVARRLTRPLLAVTRARLAEYAECTTLRFREDASNYSQCFLRNRVRHEVLPVLREIFAESLSSTLVTTQERLYAEEQSLLHLVQHADTLPPAVVQVLPPWRLLQEKAKQSVPEHVHQIAYADYQRILDCIARPSTKMRTVELGSGLFCKVAKNGDVDFYRAATVIDEKTPGCILGEYTITEDALPIDSILADAETRITARLLVPTAQRLEQLRSESLTDELRCYIDLEQLKEDLLDENRDQPLVLRGRKAGDSTVLARRGRRRVKKLIPELGITAEQSWHRYYLAQGTEVVWMPGMFRSALGLVHADSQRILALEVLSS